MTGSAWTWRAGLCAGAVIGSLALYSCGSSPAAPSPGRDAAGAVEASPPTGALSAQHAPNSPPLLVLRTRPPAAPGDPYPVIAGAAPLTVSFNACRSSDPDQPDEESGDEGDSLNWQFHFGDDGTEPFAQDGTFNANVGHLCRTQHTYPEGRYVATVSVTDKHLEDQGRGVAALARVAERFTIDATGTAATPAPSCLGMLSGTIDGSEPTFNRPNCPGGLPPCAPSGLGTAVFYETKTCSLPGAPVTIDLNANFPDTFLLLYSSFSPAAAANGVVAVNDDFMGSLTRSQISGTFPAGSYVIVVTTFANGETFDYTLDITSP